MSKIASPILSHLPNTVCAQTDWRPVSCRPDGPKFIKSKTLSKKGLSSQVDAHFEQFRMQRPLPPRFLPAALLEILQAGFGESQGHRACARRLWVEFLEEAPWRMRLACARRPLSRQGWHCVPFCNPAHASAAALGTGEKRAAQRTGKKRASCEKWQ